jgi:hypothetical protein
VGDERDHETYVARVEAIDAVFTRRCATTFSRRVGKLRCMIRNPVKRGRLRRARLRLRWTAEGGCPHMISFILASVGQIPGFPGLKADG